MSRYYSPEFRRFISPDKCGYQDDGQIFNGSVAWYDYLGATILGGAIGAGLGAFAGMSFSVSAPTFGWINSGGALIFGVTGSIAITVTGTEVLGAAGLLGAIYMLQKVAYLIISTKISNGRKQ